VPRAKASRECAGGRAAPAAVFALGVVVGVCALDESARAWPPDAGADMANPANWPQDPGYSTQWNLWSWLPAQSQSAPPYLGADTALGASGIHADVAWTHTIGRSDVVIAVIDSGIDWSDPDLVNKAYLNAGELSGPRMPEAADGSACGGKGALAGYDCNGDGVFTIADYLNDPRLTPPITWAGCPGGKTITGDANRNCILDAGDLIEFSTPTFRFSNGVDDDANGYVDDIAGWDFYKNDNDPYDDTLSGHGTSEARGSSAAANNQIGIAGACPACLFVMLRAGDSRVADANDFAKALVYAADNDANVAQAALETVDQTAFSRAAIDYAYARGVVVVAAMGEENSRQHTMPVTANHTLAVYALSPDGSVTASGTAVTTGASSFLGFSTCSNFGGQNMVGVGGAGCTGEAAGAAAGGAGLLYSEAIDEALMPGLSAEEVMQLLKGSADLVNVVESRSPNPDVAAAFYESLPYFSQRFGYGRLNLPAALEAIDSGLIPPEVDIVSPAWFAVLYSDIVSTSVPILGRVAASRAQSYDYRVEWAPGVEPADSDFQPLLDWVRNVPASTPTGGSDSPLAVLPPPEQLATNHPPDPDSPDHENDRTITLRVLAIAHYTKGDAQGQARRSIAIVNDQNGPDLDLLPGFPMALTGSLEASPKLADIDGDGIRDIIAGASDGQLHVLSVATGMPEELPGFPTGSGPVDGLDPSPVDMSVPSYLTAPAYANGGSGLGINPGIAREAFVGAPAIGDVNGDGTNEIVVSTWAGTVYVFGSDGQPLAGWPIRLPDVPSCPPPSKPPLQVCSDAGHVIARGAGASPVLADFDGDGKLEIVQAAFDGNVYVWHGDATPLKGFPVALHATGASRYERILSTPAVADFNGDGIPDILCGSNETVGPNGASGPVFLVDGRGQGAPSVMLPDWPIVLPTTTLLPILAEGMSGSPAVASFAASGAAQALVQGNGALPVVLPADPGVQGDAGSPPNELPVFEREGGTSQKGFDPGGEFGASSAAVAPDVMTPLFGQPAVGDLDQDGVPDVVVAGGSQALVSELAGMSMTRPAGPAQHLLAMWSGATGHMLPGAPVPLEDYAISMNAAVADITGDAYPEVLLGTGSYFAHAVDACGCEAAGWPKFTGGWIAATPAVGDLNGDHTLEVVTGTRDGALYAWQTKGTDTGVVAWESFHHDGANTGDYGHPLDQGVLRATQSPIDCSVDCPPTVAVPPPETLTPGGCGCRVAGAAFPREAEEGAAAMAIVGAALARRQKRAKVLYRAFGRDHTPRPPRRGGMPE
jgi:hypothetical protein